jgi:hypothetical protein
VRLEEVAGRPDLVYDGGAVRLDADEPEEDARVAYRRLRVLAVARENLVRLVRVVRDQGLVHEVDATDRAQHLPAGRRSRCRESEVPAVVPNTSQSFRLNSSNEMRTESATTGRDRSLARQVVLNTGAAARSLMIVRARLNDRSLK